MSSMTTGPFGALIIPMVPPVNPETTFTLTATLVNESLCSKDTPMWSHRATYSRGTMILLAPK